MKAIYKEYLFDKYYLVSEENEDISQSVDVLISLGNLFNIDITEGQELATLNMVKVASSKLGINVPKPFYLGFPESVRNLSPIALLYDQIFHYFEVNVLGIEGRKHSIFEGEISRTLFNEKTVIKKFKIVSENKAQKILDEIINDLLLSSRPLSTNAFDLVCEYICEHDDKEFKFASKNTLVKVMCETRDVNLSKHLALSDVIKLLEVINYHEYKSVNLRKLNLKNKERKFITEVINNIFENGYVDIENCFEKQKIWCGLLHHLHYKGKNNKSKEFSELIRGKENYSIYSKFEQLMKVDVSEAASYLVENKGKNTLLRNLIYILSRCHNETEIDYILNLVDTNSPLNLIQIMIHLSDCNKIEYRSFIFTKYNKLIMHGETEEEAEKRKSTLSDQVIEKAVSKIKEKLKVLLKGRVGKVYLDESMKNIALPLNESATSAGFGVLPKGTKVELPKDKIIRAFTYWEKVRDIDLSCMAIYDNLDYEEFSWRTMYNKQSKSITFSGDQVDGYDGGSEYFDINIDIYLKKNPDVRYLLFNNNVYSSSTFSDCYCKAGFMLRDKMSSGEVYEPKTIESAFIINAESTYASLFAIDLKRREFVWLNLARNSMIHVAAESPGLAVLKYASITDKINLYSFFEMMATEICDDPKDADVIISNNDYSNEKLKENVEIIRTCDFEKVLKYLQ